jgi:hypothetical protein
MPDEHPAEGYVPGSREPISRAVRLIGMRTALWVLTTVVAAVFVVAMIPLRVWLADADRNAYP